jgi:hypothetical protein
MDRRIFHGTITPGDVAQALLAEFNQGNLRTQLLGDDQNLTVQIASSQLARSGGKTALAVNIQPHEDGILVQVGEQQWLGVVASLGQSAIATLMNPWNLLNRLDDIAQDVSNLQLTDKIWQIVGAVARTKGASQELSERLKRVTCEFCGSANPVGESNCLACGAPLGKVQPRTCPDCGFVLKGEERFCPNCGKQV